MNHSLLSLAFGKSSSRCEASTLFSHHLVHGTHTLGEFCLLVCLFVLHKQTVDFVKTLDIVRFHDLRVRARNMQEDINETHKDDTRA